MMAPTGAGDWGHAMDRRRLASLAAMVVAGLASLATSATPPTPPPSVDQSVTGSVHVTSEAPVVARELRIRVDRVGQTGLVPTVSFTPMALLTMSAGEGNLRLSVAPVATNPGTVIEAFRSGSADRPPRSWALTCDQTGCEGRFGLIVEWLDPAAGETGDVDWTVKAHVDLWGGAAAALPEVELTAAEVERGIDARLTSASASGEPVRLDVDDRLAMWRVFMRLGDDPLEAAPGWPLVVTGRLVPTSKVVQAPEQGGEPGPFVFIEAAAPAKDGGMRSTTPLEPIEFEPFWACTAGQQCLASYVVGVSMGYIDPETAFDAGWNLDVRAIGVNGVAVPVEMTVKPVPPMPLIRATTKGTTVIGSGIASPDFHYTLTEGPVTDRDDRWDGLQLPTYGIVRARATWTGSSPIPPNFSVTFGPPYSSTGLPMGEEKSFAFAPGDGGRCRVGDCDLSGLLRSSIGYSGSLPSDWGVTIDWEFEAGIGTAAADGQSELTIGEVPQKP